MGHLQGIEGVEETAAPFQKDHGKEEGKQTKETPKHAASQEKPTQLRL